MRTDKLELKKTWKLTLTFSLECMNMGFLFWLGTCSKLISLEDTKAFAFALSNFDPTVFTEADDEVSSNELSLLAVLVFEILSPMCSSIRQFTRKTNIHTNTRIDTP